MLRFLTRRLLGTVIMLFGLLLGTFVLTRVLPADPARVAAGLRATPQQVAAVREQLGLDDPLWRQFFGYLHQMLTGDFGRSFVSQRSVTSDISQMFPATFELVAFSMVLMLIIGVPIGFYCAVGNREGIATVLRGIAFSAMGVPAFVVALLAQVLFFGRLGWFPAGGRISGAPPATITHLYTVDALLTGNLHAFSSALWHLLLPGISLAIYRAGMVARFTESQVRKVMEADHVRTAKAKGLHSFRLIRRHVVRGSAVPILAIAGLEFGWLLGGSVLVESIYSWPGMGNYILTSVASFDYNPVIMCVLVLGTAFAVINFVVDVIQAVLDPRVVLR